MGRACRSVTLAPTLLRKMAKMTRCHHYRVFLCHGSYYSLSAANVKQAICQARTTARKAFGFRKQESLKVERIQRFVRRAGRLEEVELKIPRT